MKAELGKVFILGYRQYSGEGIKQGIDVQNEIGRLKDELALVANPYGVSAEYSVGVGRWSSVPWIRLYYQENSPSAQKGVYIVYLFSAKEDAVYLALSQGTAKSNDVDLNVIKKRIQENVEPQDFLLGSESLDLGDKKSYGKAVVFYKKYERMSIPEDKELKEDAERMLSIYEECKSKHLLSVNESVGASENKFLSPPVTGNQVEKSEDKIMTSGKRAVLRLNQKILFGAPGTGKSHKIDNDLFKDENGNLLGLGLKSISQDFKFRTTFHPDYDYAQFVGSYKPKKEGSSITYSFVPQVFAKAYTAAWNKFIAADKKSTADNQVYLVIEEINRGNCAQIFGDIFQLLDRKDVRSEYPIDVDSDFADFIRAELADKFNDYKKEICSYCEDASGESQTADDEFCKIALPPNFNILATMNTSDQSLFPMDSAFKRRFDWEYVPIDFEGKDCASYQIKVDDENSYPWQKFVESVNEKIVSITDSEDKQLGEYFIKLNPVDNNVITKERFLGKVMFYLWNEVCKDVHKQESFFREEENGNYFTFQDLYKKDGDKKLISFMDWITK